MIRNSSQDIVHKEVRDCLSVTQPNSVEERVRYEPRPQQRLGTSTRSKSKDDLDGDRDGGFRKQEMRVWNDNQDLPDVVRRLGAKASAKQEKLEKQRREENKIVMSEVKAKPQISEYDYKSLSRTPLHLRDYNNFAERKNEQMRNNIINKEKKDFKECTFSPTINKKTSDNLRAKTPNELISWKQEKDTNLALMRMENADQVGAECTFKPEINPKSRKIASNHEGANLPLKRSKHKYVEEFLKKEKDDLFHPKINVISEQIVKNGYKRPVEFEVKQLKKKADQEKQRSLSQVKGNQTKRQYQIEEYKRTDYTPTAEEIIERYKKDAKPRRREIKRSFTPQQVGRAKSLDMPSFEESPIKTAKEGKNLGKGSTASKEELREVLKAANDKLQKQRAAKIERSSHKSKTPSKNKVSLEDTLKTQSVSTSNNAACYRLDREPSQKQQREFDNDYWFTHVKEKNEDHLRKQVEKLIYRDSLEKKSPSKSAKKPQDSVSPLKK